MSENKKSTFECITISREDFEERGFDTSKISDDKMTYIANKIGDAICDNIYWNLIDEYGGEYMCKKQYLVN